MDNGSRHERSNFSILLNDTHMFRDRDEAPIFSQRVKPWLDFDRDQIERAIIAALPKTTVFTHLEPLEDPISWEDQTLDRFESQGNTSGVLTNKIR